MKTLNTVGKKTLILPDVHQDICWVEKVLKKESPDMIISLGDWFDSFKEPPEVYSARETAKYLKDLIKTWGDNFVWCVANHDMPYYETAPFAKQFKNKRNIFTKCSGFSNSKSIEINKELNEEHWGKFIPFCMINNEWIVSHAGISKNWWIPCRGVPDISCLHFLYSKAKEAINNCRSMPFEILDAGIARGGSAVVGGFTWLDWSEEFTDEIPFKQIVGHSTKFNNVRQCGRSFCIDGMQHTYAVVNKDRFITIKSIEESFVFEEFDKYNKNLVSDTCEREVNID